MRLRHFILAFLLGSAFATNYTVKPGGGGDFTTIAGCTGQMNTNGSGQADTCTVFAGTYTENPTINASTVGHLKTLTVNGSDTVSIVGNLTIGSYVSVLGNCPTMQGTVITTASCGFFFSRTASPTSNCITVSASSTVFTISNSQMYACGPLTVPSTATFGHITGVTITYPDATVAQATNCNLVCSTGVGPSTANKGSHMLYELMDLSHNSDGFSSFFGQNNVIRKSKMHDVLQSDCDNGTHSSNCHVDFMESEPNIPSGNLVVESLNEVNDPTVQGHGFLTQGDVCSGSCSQAIFRFIQIVHVGGGCLIDDLGGYTNVKFYNNTMADCSSAQFSSGNVGTHWKSASTGGAALNLIFYYPGSATNFNPVGCEDTSCSPFAHGHNIAFCVTGCGTGGNGLRGYQYGTGAWLDDATNKYTDPLFNGYSSTLLGDLSLQSGSPARNAGTSLTTVNGSISGSTSLVVADAGYFQDGMTIPGVQGDCIRVSSWGSSPVCITAVNYATKTLTLASPITATNGDAVWLYSISDGTVVATDSTAPDMGAIPFNSTYTITVSSIIGSGTVTSSDSVINCTTGTTGTCTDATATGTVTLTEAPAVGYTFTSWSGGTCSGSATTCNVTGTATVTATFTIIPGQTYSARTDVTDQALPGTIPCPYSGSGCTAGNGSLTGAAGYRFVPEPVGYNTTYVRLTDSTVGSTQHQFNVCADASSEFHEVGKNNDRVVLTETGNTQRVFALAPLTFSPTYASSFTSPGTHCASWSYTQPYILYHVHRNTSTNDLAIWSYDFSPTNCPVISTCNPTAVQVVDLGTACSIGALTGNVNAQVTEGVSASKDDQSFGVLGSTTGSQGAAGAQYAILWNRTNGCTYWNTGTGHTFVNGVDQGAINITDTFYMHNLQLGTGNHWLKVSMQSGTCQSTCTSGATNYFWDVNVPSTVNVATNVNTCGHTALGFNSYVNKCNDATNNQDLLKTSLSNVNAPVSQPSTFPSPDNSNDCHISWANDNAADTNPFFGFMNYATSFTPQHAWDSELLGVATDGTGKVYRFGHTFGTPTMLPFLTGNVSQDGTVEIWTSDWDGMLGNTDNVTVACDPITVKNCRTDVFLAVLINTQPIPGAQIGNGAKISNGAVIR